MKTIKYFAIALAALLTTACQKDWDAPTDFSSVIGNPDIQETNVITLAELKAKFASKLDADGYMYNEITEDLQVKVVVTGNDIGSNLYKQICVQDETGGIIIGINQSGLSGELGIGQQILINLKGLYYGGYGSQPQIGMPYNNDGRTQIGQINKYLWKQHFKLLEMQTPKEPVDFRTIADNVKLNCGQLATIKELTLRETSEGLLFAPAYSDNIANKYTWIGKTKNYVHHTINSKNLNQKIIVRTSTYAEFASMELPKRCNLTGIFTRYGDDWQILIRSAKDIEILDE